MSKRPSQHRWLPHLAPVSLLVWVARHPKSGTDRDILVRKHKGSDRNGGLSRSPSERMLNLGVDSATSQRGQRSLFFVLFPCPFADVVDLADTQP